MANEVSAVTATNAMQAIPFGSIIGGPLNAAVEAQAMAAKATWEFIEKVGLSEKDGHREAVVVSFQYMQNGQTVQLNVPLLTIVPIPYMAIHTVDITFKAKIDASASSHSEKSESTKGSLSGELTWAFGDRSSILRAAFPLRRTLRLPRSQSIA